MAIVLYNAPRSSASRRVRLCLEEKGLPYESRTVDMERLEHHSPEYLEINPDGVVPTMVHDGRPLHESGTICEYLDELHPDPPLRPVAPYDRALMRNWVRHIDGRIHGGFKWSSQRLGREDCDGGSAAL
jgi:glutathione S-transferase